MSMIQFRQCDVCGNVIKQQIPYMQMSFSRVANGSPSMPDVALNNKFFHCAKEQAMLIPAHQNGSRAQDVCKDCYDKVGLSSISL